MNLKSFLFLIICCFSLLTIRANKIAITNVSIEGKNTTDNFQLVKFDLTWDNSWHINGGPQNWDAAWVFVKYRLKSDNIWHHATLHYVNGTGTADGHTEPALCNIRSSNDRSPDPIAGAHGVFIHAADIFSQGIVTYTGVRLRWDYGSDDLGDGDNVEISVTGIEMVYVRQGSFVVGSGGSESGEFYTATTPPSTTTPYIISSEAAITVGTTAGNLDYSSPIGESGDGQGPIPISFPKGYAAFYCLKYEITQSQYVAFLNKLSYVQQVTRTAVTPSSVDGTLAMTTIGNEYRNGIEISTSGVVSSTPAIYACNFMNDTNFDQPEDGQSIACNYLSWADVAAYLDWAALRPMTEFEFEKAGRGNQAPVPNEYAWGSTSITQATTITNPGATNEIAQIGANCAYDNSFDVQGPMRSGIFAQAATTRLAAGASYYGIMELSGNLYERPVTVGNPIGRAYSGLHGNGVLDGLGNANQATWSATSALGVGFRGGVWFGSASLLRLSDRHFAAFINVIRDGGLGGRGVRSAPAP